MKNLILLVALLISSASFGQMPDFASRDTTGCEVIIPKIFVPEFSETLQEFNFIHRTFSSDEKYYFMFNDVVDRDEAYNTVLQRSNSYDLIFAKIKREDED